MGFQRLRNKGMKEYKKVDADATISNLIKENSEIKERNKWLEEELERTYARLSWHHSYVRPPKDPNYPRSIECVFAELEKYKKEVARLSGYQRLEDLENLKELEKKGK